MIVGWIVTGGALWGLWRVFECCTRPVAARAALVACERMFAAPALDDEIEHVEALADFDRRLGIAPPPPKAPVLRPVPRVPRPGPGRAVIE